MHNQTNSDNKNETPENRCHVKTSAHSFKRFT